jgi:hypothetical protein
MIANIDFDGTFDRHFTPDAAPQARAEIANAIREALAEEPEPARWDAIIRWHEERQAFSVDLKRDGEAFDKRPAAHRDDADFLPWNAESDRGRHAAFLGYTRGLLQAQRARLAYAPQ